MLVIRKAQMDTLEADARRRFLQRTLVRLRTELAAQTAKLSDLQLRGRVESAWKRAKPYGISAERDVTAFIDLDVLLGDRFEAEPKHTWIRQLLLDASLPPNAKLQLIYTRLAAQEAAATAPAS